MSVLSARFHYMSVPKILTIQNLVMTDSEQKLIAEHSAAIRELQNDFQKFFRIVQRILPEIEETRTMRRIEQDRKDFLSRNHTGLV